MILMQRSIEVLADKVGLLTEGLYSLKRQHSSEWYGRSDCDDAFHAGMRREKPSSGALSSSAPPRVLLRNIKSPGTSRSTERLPKCP